MKKALSRKRIKNFFEMKKDKGTFFGRKNCKKIRGRGVRAREL